MITFVCKTCGISFRAYASANRLFCSKGCITSDIRHKTHGESRTRLHAIWCHMKTRCLCSTSKQFHYYGGRGIRVCDSWRESYESFRDWAMKSGYEYPLELDRKDVDGDYCPENCRWATRVQQMRNTRKKSDAKTSRFKGVSWCANVGKWRVQLHKNGKPIHGGLFVVEEEAARQYDRLAAEMYGEFANPNFRPQGGVSS